MKRVLMMFFILVSAFVIVGCTQETEKEKGDKEILSVESKDENSKEECLDADSYKELSIIDKYLEVDSYKELFIINEITLTQYMNQNKKIINDKDEINILLSILKLESQNFNEQLLKLEDNLIQKLAGYVKIEITASSQSHKDTLCFYITENGTLYEQIDNFVRYTERNSVSYIELLNYILKYGE